MLPSEFIVSFVFSLSKLNMFYEAKQFQLSLIAGRCNSVLKNEAIGEAELCMIIKDSKLHRL